MMPCLQPAGREKVVAASESEAIAPLGRDCLGARWESNPSTESVTLFENVTRSAPAEKL
jgi:hypothetical protein